MSSRGLMSCSRAQSVPTVSGSLPRPKHGDHRHWDLGIGAYSIRSFFPRSRLQVARYARVIVDGVCRRRLRQRVHPRGGGADEHPSRAHARASTRPTRTTSAVAPRGADGLGQPRASRHHKIWADSIRFTRSQEVSSRRWKRDWAPERRDG